MQKRRYSSNSKNREPAIFLLLLVVKTFSVDSFLTHGTMKCERVHVCNSKHKRVNPRSFTGSSKRRMRARDNAKPSTNGESTELLERC